MADDGRDKVDWQPREAEPWIGSRFRRLRPGDAMEVVLLEDPFLVQLHYLDGQGSLPHRRAECPHCPRRVIRRHYAAALLVTRPADRPPTIRPIVPELGDEAMAGLEGQKDICGLAVMLRKGPRRTAPITLEDKRQDEREKAAKHWFDAWPVLLATWGEPDLQRAVEQTPEGRREMRVYRVA